MPRHLLPRNRQTIPNATPGEWVDWTNNFNTFPHDIIIGDSEVNITSIPSPWARMMLFNDAMRDINHHLHLKVMSSILDVLEIIFFRNLFSFTLITESIDLRNGGNNRFIQILDNLKPMVQHNNGLDPLFSEISLIIVEMGNDRFVLAGSSPYTFVFTPIGIHKRLKRYFRDDAVFLKDRPQEFQRYINQEFIPRLAQNGSFGDMVNALRFPVGICSGSIDEPLEYRAVECELVFVNNAYRDILLTSDQGILSDSLIVPSRQIDKSPLLFDLSVRLAGRPYYNGYKFLRDHERRELEVHRRDELPDEYISYPWILPVSDFFSEKIIKYKQQLNSDVLMLGSPGNTEFVPPLTEVYFRYYTLNDINKQLSIRSNANSVIVTLRIPLVGGQTTEIRKEYMIQQNNGTVVEFDNKDIDTPLPHIIIWPKLRPQNWNDKYYVFVYGKRYSKDGNEADFPLRFLDEYRSEIQYRSSRKSEKVEVFELDTLPSYIVFSNASFQPATLTIDHNKIPVYEPINQGAKVGIDFGTSHTTISIAVNGVVRLLDYSSGFSENVINNLDFISFNVWDQQNVLLLNMKPNVDQYFLPNNLRTQANEGSVSFPLPSIIITERNKAPHAILQSSINFSKHRFFPFEINARMVYKEVERLSDLKWDPDYRTQLVTKEYLRILLMLAKYEVVKNGIDLQRAVFLWAFPKSFSSVHVDAYEKMWRQLIAGELRSTDESKATLLFFERIGKLSSMAASMSIVIDIGGGSSDVSVWCDGNIKMLYSSRWAGKNLVGHMQDNKFHSLIYEKFTKRYQQIVANFTDLKDCQTRLNYLLYSIEENELHAYAGTDDFYPVHFEILYFYSALFYEIGLQCRRFIDDDIDEVNIFLAGNGSRFACWSSGNGGEIGWSDKAIYISMLKLAMNLGKNVKVEIKSSDRQKEEVAIGLCHGREDLWDLQPEGEPFILEVLNISGNLNQQSDCIIADFDQLIIDNTNQRELIASIGIDNRQSVLKRFHEDFFREIKQSDLYVQSLRNDRALQDLVELKRTILDNEWNNIIGAIRQRVLDNIRDYNSISSSVFIIGMQIIMENLHRYMSPIPYNG